MKARRRVWILPLLPLPFLSVCILLPVLRDRLPQYRETFNPVGRTDARESAARLESLSSPRSSLSTSPTTVDLSAVPDELDTPRIDALLREVRQTARIARTEAWHLRSLTRTFKELLRTGDLNRANSVWTQVHERLDVLRMHVRDLGQLRKRWEELASERGAPASFDSSIAIEGFVRFPEAMSDLALAWPALESHSAPWTPTGEAFVQEARRAMKTYAALWRAIETFEARNRKVRGAEQF